MADNDRYGRYGRDEGGYDRGHEARGGLDPDDRDFAARTRQEAYDRGRPEEEDERDEDRRGDFGPPRGDEARERGYDDFRRSREARMRGDYERWRGGRGSRGEARYDQRGRSSASGLEVFDRSLQLTHIWLNEIVDEIGPDKQVAWHALTAVLRTIRDRIQPELAVHLGAQLPLLVRGAYYDQFRLSWSPERTRSFDDFLDSIADHMRGIGRPVNPRDAFHAVARTLTRHVSEGQVRKVVDSLPAAVRRSWIDSCRDMEGPEMRSDDRYR